MKALQHWLLAVLVTGCTIPSLAQKVKVGFDKSTDFSKFRTYTWASPQVPSTRPLLYDYVVSTIDSELNAKGFARAERNGDLTLISAGGVEYGDNLPVGTPILPIYGGPPLDVNASMWTGASPSSVSSGPIVAQGSLTLEFVDRSRNTVIWNGTVSEKLNPDRKPESLDRAGKSIVKLLKGFPPKRR
jgi:hypothetical protein